MLKTKKKLDYCVPPILVSDLTSQCAAHFFQLVLDQLPEHVAGVMRCGLKEPGGLVEEVEPWFHVCAGDDGWDVEDCGSWVYGDLEAKDVAAVVWKHTGAGR